jgi:3-methyladenine DNA glycosylase Tag
MVAFARIHKAAVKRHGATDLRARLPEVKTRPALKKVKDDRYFSLMSQRIFRAGLKHSVVDAKWPAFEHVFHRFDPRRVRAMSDEDIEGLLQDARIIRHLGKLRAVHGNAAALLDLVVERGSFGSYLADWPVEEIVALWADLAKRFAQMGGNSAPRFLRMVGKDTFILTPAVVKALNHWGAFAGEPKNKAARQAVQQVFNQWAAETGMPLSHLSMILAASTD